MGNKNLLLLILLLSLIIIAVFLPMRVVFYQQDEWRALGEYLALNNFSEVFSRYSPVKILLADGRMLASILGYILIAKFPFNTMPVFIFTLGFHVFNTVLVYFLARKFIKENLLCFLVAIFFGISSVSIGAVTWYGTSIGTLPSTSLIILSVIYLLKAVEGNSKKYFFITFLLLYASQYFKEIGYFFLLFFPALALVLKRIPYKVFIGNFWYYFLSFISIAIYRYTQLSVYTANTQVFTSQQTDNFFLVVFARAIFYPLTSFSLVYIPPEFLLKVAKFFARVYYPFLPSEHLALLIQSVVGDMLAVLASGFLLIILFAVSGIKERRKILFLVLLAMATYLPYIILSKDYTYLDSRYYYLGAVPAGILIGTFISRLKVLSLKAYFLSVLAFLVYLFLLGSLTTQQINQLAKVSKERTNLLSQLSALKPTLDKNVIFYITGDRNYYLSEGNNMPFQQGTGYTLLTLYSRTDDSFNVFLKEGLLWDLGSQGYYETNGRGFGYFWDRTLLNETIKEKNLQETDIVNLYYDSSSNLLKKVNSAK